jgi:hypothetical protein
VLLPACLRLAHITDSDDDTVRNNDFMSGTSGVPAEIVKMQAALRSWLHRVASGGARGLRAMPAPALLSVLCASALSPLIAAMAGIASTGAALAGNNILSSFGSGILSGIITDTLEQARSKGVPQDAGEADGPMGLDRLSGKVAAEIDRVLTAGDASAMAMRAELASLLAAVDEGGSVLRAALEEQGEQVRAEVLAAIAELGSDFAGMYSRIGDVVKTTAVIQSKLDDQSAGVQTLIAHSRRQSDDIGVIREDIGVIREDVAAIARRSGGTPATGDGSASGREVIQAQLPTPHAEPSRLDTGKPSPSVAARRRRLIGPAILITAVMVALASAAALPGRSPSGQAAAGASARSSLTGDSCNPQISSVTAIAAAQTRHVVIKGTCFGTGGPISGDSDDFEIMDLDGHWTACSQDQSDQVTCDITKWTSTSIILDGLAGAYGSNGQELNPDDRVIVSVGNRQGSGVPGRCVVIVGQPGTSKCQPGCTPKIDSVSQFAAVQKPTVVIKGSCFGVFAGVSAGFNGNVPFFVIIDNSGERWAGCGIQNTGEGFGVTCHVSHWSPTSITFNGFGGEYGEDGYELHRGDHLLIEIRNVRDDGSPGMCNVIAGASVVTACQGNG